MSLTDSLLGDAARALSRESAAEVELTDPEPLQSESTVLRARASVTDGAIPGSVIIKQATDTTFDHPDHRGAPQRFLNEWAALSFLHEIGVRVAPAVLAADQDRGFLVLEDLGDLPDLQSVLFGADGGEARRGLVELGRLMGEMQAASHGLEARFLLAQEALGTGSPRCDSTVDQRERKDLFHGCLEALGIPMASRFWVGVVDIESAIHDGSPFWSFIHADAGPQNLLVSPKRSALVDFEYAVYRNGLCDVVGARLGFPQTIHARQVAPDDARLVEDAFRATVAMAIPEASDDEVFYRALTAAGAHWALNRWAASWRKQIQPALDPGQGDPDAADLARTLLVLDGFTALSAEYGDFADVAATVASYAGELRRRWPTLEAPGTYPSLRNG